jgi:hypothetical protein
MSNQYSGINIIMTTPTILVINTGTSANSGDGDTLRTAFSKINYNFSLVENQLAAAGAFTGTTTSTNFSNLGDLFVIGATISTTATDEGIVLSPNGTGTVITQSILDVVEGIRFSDGTIQRSANTSTLTVSQVTTGTTTVFSNTVSNVTNLVFDTEAGFTVDQFGNATAFISMNSTFKYWVVDGQRTLIAVGLDTMHFLTGPGISIVTDPTAAPQTIQFSVIPATTTTLGGVIVGQGLTVDTSGVLSVNTMSNLGNFLVDGNIMYPSSPSQETIISNQDAQNGSYLLIPAVTDVGTPATLLGPNQGGVLITTAVDSSDPITIAPNDNTIGPGYIVMAAWGNTGTAGVYISSTATEINMYPNDIIPALTSIATGQNIGTLDIATTEGNDITIRPGGMSLTTGTVYVSGNIVVDSITVKNGASIGNRTTSTGAGGFSVTSSTFRTNATRLDLTSYIQKVNGPNNYYLPPGTEGQMMHFVPKNGTASGTNVTIWFDSIRIFSGSTASTSSNRAWHPFVGVGLQYAIYTDNAWNLSTNNLI